MTTIKKIKVIADEISFNGVLNFGLCRNLTTEIKRRSAATSETSKAGTIKDAIGAEFELKTKKLRFNGLLNFGTAVNLKTSTDPLSFTDELPSEVTSVNTSPDRIAENDMSDEYETASSTSLVENRRMHVNEATLQSAESLSPESPCSSSCERRAENRNSVNSEAVASCSKAQTKFSQGTKTFAKKTFATKISRPNRIFSSKTRLTVSSSSSQEDSIQLSSKKVRSRKVCWTRGRRRSNFTDET